LIVRLFEVRRAALRRGIVGAAEDLFSRFNGSQPKSPSVPAEAVPKSWIA